MCLILALGGCWGGKSEPDGAAGATANGARAAEALQREVWDACFVEGERIGYAHTAYYSATEAGKPAVKIVGAIHIALKRFDQEMQQQISTTSIETPGGQLLRFETQMQMGPSPLRTTGRVVGKRLEMETVSKDKKMHSLLDWSAEYRGFFGMEQSLAEKPMRPGERRTLRTLMAGFDQVATIEMLARDWQQTPLLHGTYELLPIDTMAIFPNGQKLEETVWIDRSGETLKRRSREMQTETFRTTKVEALADREGPRFDIGLRTTVKLDKPLPNARETKKVVYRVRLEGGDPAAVFAGGSTQSVKSLDANTAEVTVYALRPDSKGTQLLSEKRAASHSGDDADGKEPQLTSGKVAASPADPPTADDRRANNWIQSDNPRIISLAKEAAGDQADPWQTAVKLERFVNGYIKKKNFSQAFASAAEVLDTREGDCTEHAVLLAALCRARGIAARVAIGLVYMPATQEFGYHLWDEVCIKNKTASPVPLVKGSDNSPLPTNLRSVPGEGQGEGASGGGVWIPIDATLGLGGIGADHLKLAHSSLKGASAYSGFLPVVQVVGRLKIEVVQAE